MVRFVNCVRKKEGMSQQEFRDFWNSETFDDLRNRVATVFGAIKSSKSLTLQVEANVILRQKRGTAEPYDGVFEYLLKDAASLMAVYDSEDAQIVMQEMAEYQKQFVDSAGSACFFTEG